MINLPIITVLLCHQRLDPTITNNNLHRTMIRTIILLDPIAPQVIPILIIPMMREMEDIKHIQIQAFCVSRRRHVLLFVYSIIIVLTLV